jgi:hypothetical protein
MEIPNRWSPGKMHWRLPIARAEQIASRFDTSLVDGLDNEPCKYFPAPHRYGHFGMLCYFDTVGIDLHQWQ